MHPSQVLAFLVFIVLQRSLIRLCRDRSIRLELDLIGPVQKAGLALITPLRRASTNKAFEYAR